MNKLFSSLLMISSLTACSNQLQPVVQQNAQTSLPKNIIMVVADGMGPVYPSAYRYFNDDPSTPQIEETVFDRHFVGISSTYPARKSGYITDSAASATSLSAGVKTYNGAIGVDLNKQPVQTVLEWAKQQQKRTGVVVTSQINHATPASYLAHNEHRRNYNAIADDYIDEGIKADVYLGGGWKYFIREDRNLVNEFKQAGFYYVDKYDDLENVPENTPLLGLFANSGLPYALDDTKKHRLSLMTQAAINQLENDNGFFMLVEASQVDWAGHSNDIASAMTEMDDLAKTMEYLESYVAQNPDTLVVLTADHSTGGLTIAANGKYEWTPSFIHTMTMSPGAIAKQLANTKMTVNSISNLLNFIVTQDEVQTLKKVKLDANEKLRDYKALDIAEQKKQKKPNVNKQLSTSIKHLIDSRTNTGWTSSGHTGIDVPVYAMGAQHHRFKGKLDNIDIAQKIFTLLGKEQH